MGTRNDKVLQTPPPQQTIEILQAPPPRHRWQSSVDSPHPPPPHTHTDHDKVLQTPPPLHPTQTIITKFCRQPHPPPHPRFIMHYPLVIMKLVYPWWGHSQAILIYPQGLKRLTSNWSIIHRPIIYIGKIQKTWVFCCTVYTARKTHNIRVFWHEKTRISYWFFGIKWCACATSLYLWPYVHVVRITSRAAVGWFRRRSRTTWPKTRIIPARLELAFTLAKNLWKTGGVSKNPTPEVGFSIQVFWCKCKRLSCMNLAINHLLRQIARQPWILHFKVVRNHH